MRPLLAPIVQGLADPFDDPLYPEAVPCLDDELETAMLAREVELLHVRCLALTAEAPTCDEVELRIERLSVMRPPDAATRAPARAR